MSCIYFNKVALTLKFNIFLSESATKFKFSLIQMFAAEFSQQFLTLMRTKNSTLLYEVKFLIQWENNQYTHSPINRDFL